MKNLNFKVKDFCFCEFTLQQIKEIKENRITSVSDGVCSMSSHDLSDRCFPLDLKIKRISDTVAYYSNKFHALKNNSINYPDLNRELIKRWVNMCNCTDDKELQKLYDSLGSFCNSVIEAVENLNFIQIEGVNIIRR